MRSDVRFSTGAVESSRLQTQARLLAPYTSRFLAQAGISAGMRVLDLGSGAGDVAFCLAEMVGPDGAVLGVERDAAMLDIARARAASRGLRNVSFVVGDLASMPLDGSFDALVGRCVLFFVPDRAAALRRLLDHLRAGGIVAFQEPGNQILPPSALPPSPLLDQMWGWITDVFRHTGQDLFAGARLFSIFQEAGLPDPQMHLDAFVGGGADWPGYAYLASLVHTLLPSILEYGIATEGQVQIDTLAERLREETVSRGAVVTTWSFISAWTRAHAPAHLHPHSPER